MRMLLLALAGTLTLSACADDGRVHNYPASNGLYVEPLPNGDFTVPWRGKSGDPAFWCAAGDYVVRRLHQPVTTPIYRLSPPPRRQGEGITFSLSPEGASPRTGIFTLSRKGNYKTAGSAQNLCEPNYDPVD